MIGRDEKMLIVFEWIRTAAKSDISVLILGPTGSGKEVVARMIHELSARGRENFQAVNCAALPDTLFESEIFGYEKGAFTGANDRKPGRVELADRGTLFLDEIGDLSLVAQAKLLRVLEDRRFERLGGQKSIEVDFRLISATNRPLDEFVRDSRFREDLYYRVNAFAIRLPSLRERPVDIPVLANRFVARYCAANGLPLDAKVFSDEAVTQLHELPLAGQHPRAGKHRVARGAVGAWTRHPRRRHRVPARARDVHGGLGRGQAARCRRCATPSARTSSGCSRPCPGTRRRPRGCSRSAAARCTARSRNISSTRRGCLETAHRPSLKAVSCPKNGPQSRSQYRTHASARLRTRLHKLQRGRGLWCADPAHRAVERGFARRVRSAANVKHDKGLHGNWRGKASRGTQLAIAAVHEFSPPLPLRGLLPRPRSGGPAWSSEDYLDSRSGFGFGFRLPGT